MTVCVTENSSEPGNEATCTCTLHPVTHQNIPASRSEDSSAWRLPVSGGDSSLLVGHYPSHDTTELNESRDKLRMLANRRAMQRLRTPSLILKRVQITQSETLTPYIKMTERRINVQSELQLLKQHKYMYLYSSRNTRAAEISCDSYIVPLCRFRGPLLW